MCVFYFNQAYEGDKCIRSNKTCKRHDFYITTGINTNIRLCVPFVALTKQTLLQKSMHYSLSYLAVISNANNKILFIPSKLSLQSLAWKVKLDCLQSFKGRWNHSEACAGISAWCGPNAAENWPVTPETGQSQFTDGKLRGRHWLMGKTQLVIVAGVIPARTLLFPPLIFHQASGWNKNLTIDLTFSN